MIRKTMHNIAKKLEHLLSYDIPAGRSFDLLESRARTVEEMVVIGVMRESYEELKRQNMPPLQADSSSRSARMPSMALSR